ncbi:HEAT repeat domain-containing protein [Kribbella sp. NPDC058245]|uniref:HEAT repeat domain-containing protein n=1 Tax=Kribbella sp. NPDC058245 TaxID=3346399 RepID=UPI0036E9C364
MDRIDELIGRLIDEAQWESAAGELLTEFSRGDSLERLVPMLRSGIPAVVKAGAWIASELGERAAPLLGEMTVLLDHPLRYVRLFAIDTVLATAGANDGPAVVKAVALTGDQDTAVRWKAVKFLARVGDGQLAAAVDHLAEGRLRSRLEWLRSGDGIGVAVGLRDTDAEVRLFAAAAAARRADSDFDLLVLAAAVSDEEVASFAQEQLDLLALKTKLPLNSYDIVRIGRSATTIRLGIAGRTGVVRGISTPQVFGVVVDELVYTVDLADLTPTGERARSEDFRSGESIKVRPQRYGSEGR